MVRPPRQVNFNKKLLLNLDNALHRLFALKSRLLDVDFVRTVLLVTLLAVDFCDLRDDRLDTCADTSDFISRLHSLYVNPLRDRSASFEISLGGRFFSFNGLRSIIEIAVVNAGLRGERPSGRELDRF